VTTVTTAIVTVIGMFAAYGISQYQFRGGNFVLLTLLVTRIIPPLSLLLSFYLVVSYLGLVDNVLSIIIANIYLTYPFAVLIMKSFFDTFPREPIDSAIVDGCSRTGALLRIVLPVGAPGIASAAIITFLWTWNEFIYAFIFTFTSKAQPVTVGCFDCIGDIFVKMICLPVNSLLQPQFEKKVFEESDDYIIFQDELGVKKKMNKKEASRPQFPHWPAENRSGFEFLDSTLGGGAVRDKSRLR
jgi:multiple sugar transport system permease protein